MGAIDKEEEEDTSFDRISIYYMIGEIRENLKAKSMGHKRKAMKGAMKILYVEVAGKAAALAKLKITKLFDEAVDTIVDDPDLALAIAGAAGPDQGTPYGRAPD